MLINQNRKFIYYNLSRAVYFTFKRFSTPTQRSLIFGYSQYFLSYIVKIDINFNLIHTL